MLTLNSNKQKLKYALLGKKVPVYEAYTDDEGVEHRLDTGETKLVYDAPVEFKGNITMSGGQSEAAEFGLDISQYSAVLLVSKGLLPIDETSLIWQDTEPRFDVDGNVDESSADYTVVKLSKSLNYDRYVLRRVVK